MSKPNLFEDFLQERHSDQYTGTKDDMADDYEKWLSELDIEAWLVMGDWFGNKQFVKALNKCKDILGDVVG
jgi:hypothetical protein